MHKFNWLFFLLFFITFNSIAFTTNYWLVFGSDKYEKKLWDEYFKEKGKKDQTTYTWIDGSEGGGRLGENQENYTEQMINMGLKQGKAQINFNNIQSIYSGLKEYDNKLDGIVFSKLTAKYFEWSKEHIEALATFLKPGGVMYIPEDEEGHNKDAESYYTIENGKFLYEFGEDGLSEPSYKTPYDFAKDIIERRLRQSSKLNKFLVGGDFDERYNTKRSFFIDSPYDGENSEYGKQTLANPFSEIFSKETIINLGEKLLLNDVEKLLEKDSQNLLSLRDMFIKLDLTRVFLNIGLLKKIFSRVTYVDEKASETKPYPAIASVREKVNRYYECIK